MYFILYSHYKSILGMCEGASKQSSNLKNDSAPGQRPPVLKFLDTPLSILALFTYLCDML